MTPNEEGRLSGRNAWLIVGVLTVLALILRLANFGDSLIWDEGSTRFVVHNRHFVDMLEYVKGEQEVSPPLYFILAWLSQRFGDSPELYRLLALLAGLATVPLTFVLGRLTVGARAGILGSALVALSPFMIFYSTEARGYSLLALCVVISSIALLKALKGNRTGWWVLFAFASAAAMYAHYTALFVLAAQFVWALVAFPDRRKQLVGASIGAAILFLPWLPEYKADSDSPGANVIGALFPFDVDSAWHGLLHWSVGHPFVGAGSIPGPVFLALFATGLLLGAFGLLRRIAENGSWRPDRLIVLPVLLAVSAPIGTILFSTFSVSVFLPRNLAPSSVGLALVVAALLAAPRNTVVRWSATGLVLACFSFAAISTLNSENRRPNYLAAAGFIESKAAPGSVVVDAGGLQPAPTGNLDVAFEIKGTDLPVIRIGVPSRDDLAAAIAPGGAGRYSSFEVTPTAEVVTESLDRADGAPLFLVSGTGEVYGRMFDSPATEEFEQALRGKATEVDSREFTGLGYTVTVREFEPVEDGS